MENPFDALTDKDKELITKYVETWGPTHPNSVMGKVQPLETTLSFWNKEKATLFKMFGSKDLIVRRPYAYTVPDEGMKQLFYGECWHKEYDEFHSWYHHTIRVNYGGKINNVPINLALTKMMSDEVLCENAWTGETFILTFNDGTSMKVQKGIKPLKVLNKIAQKYGYPAEKFEAFRLWHSRLLNQKTLDGELCLSIHPLDFMTMSDNSSGWESCMHWMTDDEEPGDYRAGTIEMMNSPCVLVAYLHNPDHIMIGDLNDWEWNSKKWRELFVVQQGVIHEVKGYPYQDENLTNAVLMWIKELAHYKLHWDYSKNETNMVEPIPYEDGFARFDFTTSGFMYNDMKTMSIHRGRINTKLLPKYRYNNDYYDANTKHIYPMQVNYGGIMNCMCCGKSDNEVRFHDDSVFCTSCEMGYYCARCGEWITSSPIFIEDYDEPICEGCYEYEVSCDDLTDEPHISENMTSIWLAIGEENGVPKLLDTPIQVYYPTENDGFKASFDVEAPHQYVSTPWRAYTYVTLDEARDKDYVLDVYGYSLDDINDLPYFVPKAVS